MKVVLCGAVHVMLCMGAMAFVDTNGCYRTPEEVQTAKENPVLRKELKKYLKLTLEDIDRITWFTVYDSDFDGVANVYLVDELKTGEKISFMYGSEDDGQTRQVTGISSTDYYKYLACEVLAGDEDSDYYK
ncbi:unnamed protein product [Heligmosomoides polygyrus]|uniref:Secreted protein n=1 Tax=Heligmosomoides polygyrus TaxID=6339 RepID=A0A183FRF5_HELPZ|nr:unnamed protein product [Heligmosomoides polygyrus]